MPKVLLKDVVARIKDKVDKDNTDLKYYIGGEHFDSGEIQITKKGIIKESTIGPAFHMRFQPGDVLLMSRNPHLRKAGIVDFEGICSDVSYVCRTKDENVLMQRFIPFIFQTDHFWKFAEENKKGSTNFFLNWSDFEKYEFELPQIDEQKKLCEMMWAFEDTKSAYKDLLLQTDELVKSQFIGDIQRAFDEGRVTTLGKMVEEERPITYGIVKPGHGCPGGVPVVKVKDMQDGAIDESNLLLTTPELDYQYRRSRLRTGDLLISIRGSVGRLAEIPESLENANITQDTARLTISPQYNKIYVRGVLESPILQWDMEKNIRGVAVKGINIGYLRELKMPVCSRERQDELAMLYQQSDKSKFISFKSQFIEMFGDPDNNSKNWPLVSLKDCLVAIDSGKSITCENYPRTGDLPAILKLSAVTYGEYQPEENKQLPLAEQFIKEAEVHVGDLLFSRKNTLEYVGMTALVKQTPPKLMMPDLIFRLVPQENVRPQYLHQLINHPMYRGTISGLANGSAGSMPNISKQKLNNLAIPLPPVELQMEIEPFIEQSDKSKFELKQAIEDINNLMRVFMAQNTDKED